MLYLVCLAYVTTVFLVAKRCAGWYELLLQRGAAADRRTFWQALRLGVRSRPPYRGQSTDEPPWSQRLLLCLSVSMAVTLIGFYVYLSAVPSYVFPSALSGLRLLWELILIAALVMLAWIDLRTRLLPDAVCLPLLTIALGLGVLAPDVFRFNSISLVALVAVAAVAVYGLGYYVAKTPVIGLGDIKLYVALAACLPTLTAVLQLYVVAGALCWITQLLWQRRWLPQGSCAFGPYLIIGYLVANWPFPALQLGFTGAFY
ncbi:MAG TPA: A24 family peptidase [Paenalcaligenes sp.]|nr:A24 family peptidase [Paenalcaligenes sp.]